MLATSHPACYMGQFFGGNLHGYGHKLGLFGQTKFSYKGYYEEGEEHGKGEMIRQENYYIGNLQRGLRQGHGCDLINNSSVFLGCFKNDKRHGYGKLTQLNENETLPIEIDWGSGTIQGLNQITDDFIKLKQDCKQPNFPSYHEAAYICASVQEENSQPENNESGEVSSECDHQNQMMMQEIDHTAQESDQRDKNESKPRYMTSIYHGTLIKGTKHGSGVLVFPNGSKTFTVYNRGVLVHSH